MPQFFKAEYDDFGGGLSLRLAPHLIQKNEAVIARNVDIQDRYLRGLKGLGSTVATMPYSAKWLWYIPSATWAVGDWANEAKFALNDGPKVYATRESNRPLVITPTTNYSLGIVPPSSIAYSGTPTAGAKQGSYKYGFTFVTADGLESNPQDFDLTLVITTPSNVSFSSIPVSTDPRVVARRVYRSLANSDAMFFLYEIPDNSTTTFTDNYSDTRLDTTRPLTWSDGGFPDSGGIYVEDHSIPPALTILSTNLHATNGAVGRSGSGILFGATGATVYWSMLGFPDYWPIVNQFTLAENIESIVSLGGATFVFTPNFVYQARGDSDSSIVWNRTNAAFGVKRGMGRFTTVTAQGVLFFAQDGLAVFDGSNARLVAENKLPRDYFDSRTINAVGFFRNRFHVFTADTGDSATIIFDFRDGVSNPVITTTTHVVSAAHVANYAEPVTANALSALPASIGSIRVANAGSYKVIDGSTYTTMSLTVGSGAPTGGTQATATPLFSYDRIVVRNGGAGYDTAPTVVFAKPAGQGRVAKGVATIAGGKVIAIAITDPGEGYSPTEINNPSTITLVGGTPSSNATLDVFAKISSVSVTDSGAGYVTIPPITVNFTGTISVDAQLFAELAPELYLDVGVGIAQDASNIKAIYRFGGDRLKSPNPSSTIVDTIDKYSYGTQGWTRLSTTLTTTGGLYPYGPRRGMVYCSNGTAMYFGGGDDNITFPAPSPSPVFRKWQNESFTTLADMPERSYGALVFGPSNKLYLIGGLNSSGAMSQVSVYDIATDVWTTPASLTVSGVPYYLAFNSAVAVGTNIYIFGGLLGINTNALGANGLNPHVFIYDTLTDTTSMDSTGPSYGWLGRQSLQAVAHNNKIFLYGGSSSTAVTNPDIGSSLSDLWVYDPAATPKWSCRTGSVVNALARARAGVAYDSGSMYVIGGMTSYSLYTADALEIPLDQAADCAGTPGLYVLQDAAVKLFEGGARMADWLWQGRREVGPMPGPRLTWMRSRAMAVDSVKFGATFQNGNGGESSWPTYNTTTAGQTGLGSQVRFWYPSVPTSGAPVPTGQWLSLRLEANNSTTAEVYRVEIDAKMDTDGG